MSDINEIVKALEGVDARIDAVKNDATATLDAVKSELKKLGEEQLSHAKQLAALQQNATEVKSEKPADVSVGGRFVQSESYKSFSGNMRNSRGAREIVSVKDDPTPTGPTPTGSTVTTGITRNTLAPVYQIAGIYGAPELPLLVESLIPHVPVSTSAVSYIRNSAFTNNAAVVAEGAAKPESTFGFELRTGNVVTVAHWTKITEQLAADAPAVAAYINAKMLYGLALKVDRQLVSGTGGASQLDGLLNTGNYTDYSSAVTVPTGATLIDFALLIKSHLETLGYPPAYLVLNPADWAQLALLKDQQKRYLLGGPANVAAKTLWGVPVVTTAAVTSGKYLMADFRLGATIFDRQEVALEMDREQDDFTKNLLTIRVERRLGLVVEDPAAIAGGDWTVGS